jgi:drug/metabolite transporter (DMT)-like permease
MSPADRRRRTLLVACFAAIYLIWGSSYLATKIGVDHLPPLLFGGIRFVIAGVLLWPIARWLGRRGTFDRETWKHVLVMAVCGVLVSNGFNVWAMQWVPSNQSALLNVSSAFWIPIFGLFGARAHAIGARAGVGLALGFAGTLLVLWPEGGASATNLVPQLAVLVGCMGWAVGTIYYRNAQPRLDVLTFTAAQMFVGGLMLSALGLAAGEAPRWHWSPAGVASLAYMTLASSCLAYTAYAWLTQHTSPARVSTYGYVNPVIAAILGWLVLDERLGALAITGMVVSIAGVVLVNWPAPERQPESPG